MTPSSCPEGRNPESRNPGRRKPADSNQAGGAQAEDTEAPAAQGSKTSRKKEAEQLQQLGQQLTELKADQLQQLTLEPQLLAAVLDHQRFKSREARRRQLQYIGRIMRELDTDSIVEQMQRLSGRSAAAQYQFQQLERWRAALLSNNQSLTDFVDAYPHVDRQRLRALIKQARQADADDKKAPRALFRFLRETAAQADPQV